MFLNNKNLLLLTICLLFAAPSANSQQGFLDFLDDSVSYLWPTDASTQLSSTFAETRSAHLHSGIDIRTWGREGYRVFASRDGVIYRIGIGPHGYGHVIYMKHGDDSYTVYAHLNRFEPELQAFADSIRFLDYTYEIDLIIEDEGFHFKRGDIIGYTGSTGVGPPHLHFEIRTPQFKPVNPLLTNLSVSDNIPPVFSQLAVEFLDRESLQRTGHTILQGAERGGVHHFGEISIDGPVGLAVNVHDRANNTPNVYAVHSLKMINGADTLFHARADYFSFADGGNMFLDRSYPILAQTRRGYQRLYRVHGNRLPFYHNLVNEGVLNLDEGYHEITIVAKDIYGNESRASVSVHSQSRSDHEEITYVPAYPGFENQTAFTLLPWRRTEIPLSQSLLASADTDFSFMPGNPSLMLISPEVKSTKTRLSPGRKQIFHTPDQKVWLQFPHNSLHDTLDVKMTVKRTGGVIDITFNPGGLPLNRPAYLNFILPEDIADLDGLALFSVDTHRNRETFINASISNGILRARINRLGDLRIKQDRVAPWVGRPRLDRDLAGNHILLLPAVDRDTGIDYRNTVITINGQRGITEYDPDQDLLRFYNPSFTPRTENTVEYEVFDGAGNRTSRTVTVRR
jgi:hypothetical protein